MLTTRIDSCWQQAENGDLQNDWHIARLSTTVEMAAVIGVVLDGMTKLEYPVKALFGARLALEEAIVNSIKHGHQYDPAKVVEVRYRIGPEFILVEVRDQGPGFDPAQVPDPTARENLERAGGRGLLLIRHYATWVRFNEQGNGITFCFCPTRTPAVPYS